MTQIRKATIDDLTSILRVYTVAQDYMIETGNPTQWGHRYPDKTIVEEDIRKGECHVLCDEDGVRAVFALCEGIEPTYRVIEDGQWLNEEPYVAVHRVASDGRLRVIFGEMIRYCRAMHNNIRIDTHRDNRIMQRQIEKHGFVRCGIVHMEDGSPRIAYQWIQE